MKVPNRLKASLALLILFAVLPISSVRAAGGRLEGKVTDPKGATVAGATVTLTEPITNQTFTAVTDKQGRYKFEGLPAGPYSMVVSAAGFSDRRNEDVRIQEGGLATVDIKLDIAEIEATVTVSADKAKANADPTYQQLRQQAKTSGEFSGPYAIVNNLVIKRDAATFTLKSGEIYFAPAVKDRTFGAVFLGTGELTLTPPTEAEKRHLTIFTKEPSLTESFDKLVLRFTDKTFEEIKASPQVKMATGGPQANSAQSSYRDNQTILRRTLRRNVELRTLVDLYNPQRPGFFTAFIGGKRFNKLIFQYDPSGIPDVSPEEVLLGSYGETDFGIWAAFHRAEEYAKGTPSSDESHRLYDITHHEIDAVIRANKLTCTDTLAFKILDGSARVLPFRLFPTLRVSRVKDDQGRDLDFVQEGKNDDADFGVIFPEPLEGGKSYKLTIEYSGSDALIELRSGNFFLLPGARSTWYPNNEGTAFSDRATFDTTYHYSKNRMLVGTGAVVAPPVTEGELTAAKWSTGETSVAVNAFNYGSFTKKEVRDSDTGYNIEFYASRLDAQQPADIRLGDDGTPTPSIPPSGPSANLTMGGSMSTASMGGAMLADAQNSTRLFNAYFGKLAFNRLALTEQPNPNFGQAGPTLGYMPYSAFLDSTQRYLATGSIQAATDDFEEFVGPHEIAHQWWGHMVGWKSYRDQWMSEGFAHFSAALYAQQILRDEGKYLKFWNDQRDRTLQSQPRAAGWKPYQVGPVTQGGRLTSGKTGNAYQYVVYPKGAYILQMLRMMMFDQKNGDRRFMAMMRDFIKTHYNQDVSTEDFKRVVEKHMTNQMDLDENRRMDWFFNTWVYGTEVPSYKFEYQLNGASLSGKITQSGVSDNFKMLVPVYVDYGKGWVRLGSATIIGNSTVDLPAVKLPQTAKRAAISAQADVLALNITNSKVP